MSVSGFRVQRNTTALEGMPMLAKRQLYDAQARSNNTRKEIIARQNQAVQTGRLNASLPPESWQAMDTAVYQAAEDALTIVQDLLDMGLEYRVDIRAQYDTWGIIDDVGSATVGMTPEAQETESDIEADEDGSPIPIIDDGYSIGFRDEPVSADRLPADGLDTTKGTVASRHVSEAVENMFIDADNLQITGAGGEGYTLYGITDHPDTATGNTTTDWTVAGNESDIRSDIRAMRALLKNDRSYSPGSTGYMVYMGTEYYDELDDADPEGDGNQTVRDRVSNLANIRQIKEADFLADKSVLMFRPTEDVIQVGTGMRASTVQWEDPFRDHYRVIASHYPRIKRVNNPNGSGYVNGFVYWTAP